MPKASLEYQSYCVLNEINNIKIDGERISVELKQDIYKAVFQKGKKVTKKQLCKYLHTRGIIETEEQVTGVDVSINNALTTYGKFKPIFGEDISKDSVQKMIEDIVFWCTVYGDSKKFLKDRIEEKYGNKLSEEQIKRILGFKFKDWGNLSKKFLELNGADTSTGESISIIRALWNNNLNLMELINSSLYNYKECLAEYQNTMLKTLSEIEESQTKEERQKKHDNNVKNAITLYADADRRILQFFGGQSRFREKEDSLINLYSGEDLYKEIRKELYAIRNITFHYTTKADKDQTQKHDLAEYLFEEEFSDITELFREKYYANNVWKYYDVEVINTIMENIYCGRKYRAAQVPAFKNIISRPELPQVMNGFVKGNSLRRLMNCPDRDVINKYWSALFFVLRNCIIMISFRNRKNRKIMLKNDFSVQ